MAEYLIHLTPKRQWYVEQYLIPSMLEQGVQERDIRLYNDDKNEGNLKACMNAFLSTSDNDGTWHLQDDVLISRNFKEKTEQYDHDIVCGFNSTYDGQLPAGHITVDKMWFSFPCIRIPNKIAKDCAEWVLHYMIGNPVYRDWWKKGANDDLIFRKYVQEHYKDQKVINLDPNIVEHIDTLIGGTTNPATKRKNPIRSKSFPDNDLTEAFKIEMRRRTEQCLGLRQRVVNE